jgi:hypothetical protein
VEEKLLVNRCDKRLNVPGREERTKQRRDQGLRSGADVGRLANLASSLILPFCVGVAYRLAKKENEQDRQAKS